MIKEEMDSRQSMTGNTKKKVGKEWLRNRCG
jgi:hypothetical protein